MQPRVDASWLARWWRAENTTGDVSCSETLFSVNSVYTNNVLNARVHVVSSLLSVSKIAILMLTRYLPLALRWKWFWPENENTVDLKSDAFVVIMLLNERMTRVHSWKDPWLHFGESFTVKSIFVFVCLICKKTNIIFHCWCVSAPFLCMSL